MPRLKTDTVGTGDQSWLASLHAVREARSGTLDTSAFTKATHYPNGYFISGLPLGQITATKLYAPFNSGAADGTQTLAGFLVFDVPTDGVEDLNAAILDHGRIYTDKLPVAGITAATATSGQFVMLTKGAGA